MQITRVLSSLGLPDIQILPSAARVDRALESGARCSLACLVLPGLAAKVYLPKRVAEYAALPTDLAGVCLASVGFGAGFARGFIAA